MKNSFNAKMARTLAESVDRVENRVADLLKWIEIDAKKGLTQYETFEKISIADAVKAKLEAEGFTVQLCNELNEVKRFMIYWRDAK